MAIESATLKSKGRGNEGRRGRTEVDDRKYISSPTSYYNVR